MKKPIIILLLCILFGCKEKAKPVINVGCGIVLPQCLVMKKIHAYDDTHSYNNMYGEEYGYGWEIFIKGTNNSLRVSEGDIDSDGGMFINDDDYGTAAYNDSCELKRLFDMWLKHQSTLDYMNTPDCVKDAIGYKEAEYIPHKIKKHGDTLWVHDMRDLADSNGNINVSHKILIQY